MIIDPDALAAYAAFWGFNPWDITSAILPKDTVCHFCRKQIDPLELYAIIVEVAVYSHISCIEKAVDNDPSS